jgi:hypothetical protein
LQVYDGFDAKIKNSDCWPVNGMSPIRTSCMTPTN